MFYTGMRPCEIIVLLSELFHTESKSQVYATLHEYFRRNPEASKNFVQQIIKIPILEIKVKCLFSIHGCDISVVVENSLLF